MTPEHAPLAHRHPIDAGALAPADLARLIDHTALKPDVTLGDVQRLCDEALRYGFASVCINPCFVPEAAARLAGSAVKVCTVIGFPLGATTPEVKAREAEQAIRNGATEIDMVINIGMLKSGRKDVVARDVRAVVETARLRGADYGEVLVKVIIETALLSDEEKVAACEIAREAGADFVKTSTGFSTAGATTSDVALMRRIVGDRMGVKASGGIRSADDALAMIRSGGTRIGASASVAIVEGLTGEGDY